MKIFLIWFLIFSHAGYAKKAVNHDKVISDYGTDFVAFIQEQKKNANIPLDLRFQTIKKPPENNAHEGWPIFIAIKFENHFNEDNQFAHYWMTCVRRMTGRTCGKQEIKKLKYNNRWITNYIKSDMKSDELIDIIKFAELNKPDDWLLPLLNINYKNDLFVICFGISEHQKTHPEQYRFPRYCLPIVRTQENGQYEYQAKYDSIEYSELIVD